MAHFSSKIYRFPITVHSKGLRNNDKSASRDHLYCQCCGLQVTLSVQKNQGFLEEMTDTQVCGKNLQYELGLCFYTKEVINDYYFYGQVTFDVTWEASTGQN